MIMRPAVAELTSGSLALLHHHHRLDPIIRAYARPFAVVYPTEQYSV